MSPAEIETLKYIGTAIGIILSGITGAKINEKRSSNGKSKHVRVAECDLKHELEKERWNNLNKLYEGMSKDIRSINEQLGGVG